jgi:hypothetical protein
MRTLLHLVAAVLLLATQVWGVTIPLRTEPAPVHTVHHSIVGQPDFLGDAPVDRGIDAVLVWNDRPATTIEWPDRIPSELRAKPVAQRPAFHPRRPPPRAVATDSDLSD